MARQVLEYARTAQTVIAAKGGSNPMAMVYMEQIQHYAKLSEQVIRQTQRRVIDNEKVPAQEKIVSIFVLKEDLYARLSRGQLGDAYDFMLSFFTNSILYSPSIFSPLMDKRLTADLHRFSFPAISNF
jgi:hypothetical protein